MDGQFDANAIQSGDMIEPASGAVYTLQNGIFGKCISVEEGTTNLAGTDNDFESSTNGFVQYGTSTVTVTSSSSTAFSGINSLKAVVVATDGAGFSGVVKTGFSATAYQNKQLTLSWKIKAVGSSIGKTIYANIWDNISGSTQGTTITLDGTWQTITVTKTISATATSFNLYWLSNTLVANDVVYADCVQLEQKGYATSFTNGTRSNGIIKYPKEIINTDQGTISFWLKANPSDLSANPVFSNGVDNNGFDFLILPNNSPYLRAYSNSTTSTQLRPSIDVFSGWNHVAINWVKNSLLEVYFNGALQAQSLTPVDWSANYLNATGFYLGSGIRLNPNIMISDFRIDKTKLSAEEIVAIYISKRPQYNPYDYRAYAY
jgi:hypothetical protein